MDLRDSNLKYNLRAICSLPNDDGFACGCIEGRVSVDFVSSVDMSKSVHRSPSSPTVSSAIAKRSPETARFFP